MADGKRAQSKVGTLLRMLFWGVTITALALAILINRFGTPPPNSSSMAMDAKASNASPSPMLRGAENAHSPDEAGLQQLPLSDGPFGLKFGSHFAGTPGDVSVSPCALPVPGEGDAVGGPQNRENATHV